MCFQYVITWKSILIDDVIIYSPSKYLVWSNVNYKIWGIWEIPTSVVCWRALLVVKFAFNETFIQKISFSKYKSVHPASNNHCHLWLAYHVLPIISKGPDISDYIVDCYIPAIQWWSSIICLPLIYDISDIFVTVTCESMMME